MSCFFKFFFISFSFFFFEGKKRLLALLLLLHGLFFSSLSLAIYIDTPILEN